jgi:hypothetical protein
MQVIRTIIILLGLSTLPAAAAADVDPLFEDQSTLQVVLTAPFNTLIRKRPDEEYLPGEIRFKGADGDWVDLEVQVRARGNFRHKYCDFPPMNLNFRRSDVEGTVFEGQHKLKMAVHCKDSAQYQQAVLREFLAYRMLNSVTDLSFRVRLLEVIYVDSDERRSNLVRYAFLIEHPDRLAERIGKERLDIAYADIARIQPDELNLTSIFQYLIGNVDFSPVAGSNNECCHNYEMFGNGTDRLLAVPYDFDLAGIVNAPYAMTDKELGVEKIGQRVYRGWCGNNGYLEGSIARFQAVRDAVYALVAAQQELEPSVRDNMARYIDEFYAVVDDPEAVEREITGKCTNDP